MWGLDIGVGLMNVAGYASPAKQLRWLSSVLAGILMCKVVYDLTGVISASLVKEYRRLSRKQKLEWNNRGFSTFHAIVAAAVSLYLLLVSDLFHDSRDQLIINRTSNLSDTTLGVSIGYFLSDLTMIFYYYPALGGVEYVVHHGLSMYSIIQSLFSGQAQIYILMVLFTESTTPFVNLRWYLDVAGLKNSKLYVYNGVALFLGWLVARIILFVFFFYHMYVHFDQNMLGVLLWLRSGEIESPCQNHKRSTALLHLVLGEASLPVRLLQLAYSAPSFGYDERVLVLENRQRYGENLEQG
ncbi:TRAM protein [Perilla frutescens var. frutescens]|nr:TRAM protein [Perilla frutescens var. frutescens]